MTQLDSFISLTLLAVLALLRITDGCPTGWTEYNERCYRIEIRQWVGHNEADTGCMRRGAALAGLPDLNAAQFINNLLNASWSTSNQCRLQRRDCQVSTQDPLRYCAQQPCLNLWVGLNREAPCGANCSPGSQTLRAGWRWNDGSAYNPASTIWEAGQPLDERVAVRFGVGNSSMVMSLASYDEDWRFGYVCSRLKDSTDPAGPEYPEEGAGGWEGGSGPSDNSNVKIGLAIGLTVGLALLLVIIIIIIVIICNCRGQRKTKTEQIVNRPNAPVHYAKQRETIYFSSSDPYGVMASAEPTHIKSIDNDAEYGYDTEISRNDHEMYVYRPHSEA